jgi:hypothetical protein
MNWKDCFEGPRRFTLIKTQINADFPLCALVKTLGAPWWLNFLAFGFNGTEDQ